jgi:hypothetical protein
MGGILFYGPFKHEKRLRAGFFRIAELMPVTTGSIHCEIKAVTRDQAKGGGYTVISHSWSDSKDQPRERINADERPFYIPANLAQLLLHLRAEDHHVTSWIDALCINENDDVEKFQQVAMMGYIYRTAQLGYLWLGAPSKQDGDGFGEHLNKAFEPLSNDKFRGCFAINEGRSELKEEYKVAFKAFSTLLSLSWWRRIWTVQEMVLPKYIEFLCESGVFHFGTLKKARDDILSHDKESRKLRATLVEDGFEPFLFFEKTVAPMVSTREDWHAKRRPSRFLSFEDDSQPPRLH